MERVASWAATTSYVSWEEVSVSTDKGRRKVHYLLKRRGGGSDLAVVGKEKSIRHMSYRYAVKTTSFGPCMKLKSRRDVVDWLNSVVSDSSSGHAVTVGKHGFDHEIGTSKDNQLQKMRNSTKDFSWIGFPWTCRKRRKHYQGFKRNGFQISVNDFVFVLAEEDKRLVAYLEDLYEDSRGNKMVVVRWFHKIDEVGIDLPQSFSDREVFFSLYLQDLSIECIDGLAFVLSPQHYEKFQNEARQIRLETFVCYQQFDNDDVKPYDITHIKGYWKQEVLRNMFAQLDSKSSGSSRRSDDSLELDENHLSTASARPKKRLRITRDDTKDAVDLTAHRSENLNYSTALKSENLSNSRHNTKISSGNNSLKTIIKGTYEHALQHLVVGSLVEVLSQDSGMRGCWFAASVIKKHKEKVKVQYQDIQDAADETKKLEEWVLASRIAVPDSLGLRMHGRTMVRPAPPSIKCELSFAGDVGSVVDAWWHNGWWEGILIQKDSEANYHVYFPGEKVVSVFGPDKLRMSQEWVVNEWMTVRQRPDLVASILSTLKTEQNKYKSSGSKSKVASTRDGETQYKQSDTCSDSERDRPRKPQVVADLLKDDLLSQLRWKTTGKRRRGSSASYQKQPRSTSHRKKSPKVLKLDASDSFVIPSSLKVDHDDCKYVGDPSIFSSSVVPSLTSLVMCR